MSTVIQSPSTVVELNCNVMRAKKCVFDPVRDKKAVEPFGFVDLKSALVSGVIPSQIEEVDANYNQIDDPASILGKPNDVFDAMHMQSAINGYKPDEHEDQ